MTILVAQLVIPALPYLLSFAAGAMLYVVVEELIPEMSQGQHSNIGTLFFALGFSLMMILDVALGEEERIDSYENIDLWCWCDWILVCGFISRSRL